MATFVVAWLARKGLKEATTTAKAALEEAAATVELAEATARLADQQRRDRELAGARSLPTRTPGAGTDGKT